MPVMDRGGHLRGFAWQDDVIANVDDPHLRGRN